MRKPHTQWLPLYLLLTTCSPVPPESAVEEPAVEATAENAVDISQEEPPAAFEVEREPVEVDWNLVADLERAADDLEWLAEDVRYEVLAMGEVEGEAMPGRAQLESEWRQWSRDWIERMQSEIPTLPNVPYDSPTPELLYAKQAIEGGWHELSLLPMTSYGWTNVPAVYERERHLNAATRSAEEARQHLEKLER